MREGLTVVLDVGKTLTKLSLWTREGVLVARETRPNQRVDAGPYAALDAEGVEAWAVEVLSGFTAHGRISAIVPVAHGAAVAVLRDGRLACPSPDYEAAPPPDLRAVYDADRDAFAETGSPGLPDGLNAAIQLAWLERLHPGLLDDGATILTWAQYWAWRLSGVAATEVTSLGCHSDLWRPMAAAPSGLAAARGWARRLAPLRRADEVLGAITPDWAARTGLPADVQVHCGLHDSNAALLAARGFAEIAGEEATVLSTGTWFVAMRSPGRNASMDIARLSESRDCLVNVDAYGVPTPSARFMGGREIEILSGVDARRIDIKPDQPALLAATPEVVAARAMVLPTFTPGVGPFPGAEGRWLNAPEDPYAVRAAVSLYAALVADTSLSLIGARRAILVEGRFAEAEVFVRALASLRPHDAVYVSNAQHDVSYGALRLIGVAGTPSAPLERVKPLEIDVSGYAADWRRLAAGVEVAA